jgi:prepilin-type N-terminal cleavage/methylation domain-containing protein
MINKQHGFTLIEVMVALVVLSIGLGAILVATSQNIRTYQSLQASQIYNWIEIQASNLLNMHMIDVNPVQPYNAVTTMNGIKCHWKVELKSTGVNDDYQAVISTRLADQTHWQHHAYAYTLPPKPHE